MALVKRSVKGSPVSAEEYDAVVDVVEENSESVNVLKDQLNDTEAMFSVLDEAAMTAKWNELDALSKTPIDGRELFRVDLNQFWKWSSLVSSKGEFSRYNLKEATEISENNPGLAISGDVALYKSPYILDLESILDEITDKESPLFVNTMAFTKSSRTPGTVSVVSIISRTDDYNFTVNPTNVSSYTENSEYVLVVKDDNGKHTPYRVKNVDSVTGIVTVDNVLPSTLDSFMPMFDVNLGQHLSDYGYNALAEHIYDKIERYEYLKKTIYKYNPNDCTNTGFSDYVARDINDTNIILADFVKVGGALNGGFVYGTTNLSNECGTSSSESNVNSARLFKKTYNVRQNGIGKGVSLEIPTSYKVGYLKTFVGIYHKNYISSEDSETYYSNGGCVVTLYSEDDVEIYSETVRGGTQEINIPFESQKTIKIVFTLETDEVTEFHISGIWVYGKRDDLNINPFSDGQIVGFLGDSWTQFPPAEGGETVPKRPDGVTDADGLQFLSERFKSYALENGNNITTINQGRSGMTSEWGRYWVKEQIINWSIKPEYCIVCFYINDKNSTSNYPNTPSIYDFSSTNPFASGDVFSSTSFDKWLVNIRFIANELLRNGIKPIILMPSHTASDSQTADLTYMLNALQNNFE